MLLAWDVTRARLELKSSRNEVLCDYKQVPTCLGKWSGSTPADDIDAELIEYKSTAREQMKGKLVLTKTYSANLNGSPRRGESIH
jgi:hypothetical protein